MIPVPDGWTLLGKLKIGDKLYDESGRIRYVTSVASSHQPTYKVTFDNKETIFAAKDLPWHVTTGNDRGKNKGKSHVLTSEQLYLDKPIPGRRRWRKSYALLYANPILDAPIYCLPLDPYLLGYWLGDGTKCTGAIAVKKNDYPNLTYWAEKAGYETSFNGSYYSYIKGLVPHLQLLKTFEDKSVPLPYLRASVPDRLALLQGLMDSDGTPAFESARNTFYNTRLNLLDVVEELVHSLGGKSSRRLISEKGHVRNSINGSKPVIQTKDCYAVSFITPFNPFRLERKKRLAKISTGWQKLAMIRCVELCDQQELVNIIIDSPSHYFLCGRSMLPILDASLSP